MTHEEKLARLEAIMKRYAIFTDTDEDIKWLIENLREAWDENNYLKQRNDPDAFKKEIMRGAQMMENRKLREEIAEKTEALKAFKVTNGELSEMSLEQSKAFIYRRSSDTQFVLAKWDRTTK